MSSTEAEKITILGRLSGVRHAFRIPRGTLISSERLGTFACLRFPRRHAVVELCITVGR